jgi:plasmid maintenance system antidote protein VapI
VSWQLIRTMSPEHFAQAIRVLGLKPAQAARYLGMSERQMRRLLRGERQIGTPIVLLLNCMITHRTRPMVPRKARRVS